MAYHLELTRNYTTAQHSSGHTLSRCREVMCLARLQLEDMNCLLVASVVPLAVGCLLVLQLV